METNKHNTQDNKMEELDKPINKPINPLGYIEIKQLIEKLEEDFKAMKTQQGFTSLFLAAAKEELKKHPAPKLKPKLSH